MYVCNTDISNNIVCPSFHHNNLYTIQYESLKLVLNDMCVTYPIAGKFGRKNIWGRLLKLWHLVDFTYSNFTDNSYSSSLVWCSLDIEISTYSCTCISATFIELWLLCLYKVNLPIYTYIRIYITYVSLYY